jgi:fatty acid desaturase
MNGYMISHEWEEFCNRVDDALERMTKAARIAMYTFWFNAVACIVAVAVFMAVFLNHNIYDSDLSLLPIVIVPVVVLSFLGTGTSWYSPVKERNKSIIQICKDTLNGNSSLSFHFREEKPM